MTKIENLRLVSYFCRTNQTRGGVSIYAEGDLKITYVPSKGDAEERHFEVCAAKILSPNGKYSIYIITVYRTPDSDFKEFIGRLELLLHRLYNPKNCYVICGDTNIDFLQTSSEKSLLLNLLAEYNVINHIQEPTRISSHSATCIDNIFSNLTINNKEVHESFISDHTFQICSFQLLLSKNSRLNHTYRRNYNATNTERFQHLLSAENWTDMYTAPTFPLKFAAFYCTFLFHYNCAFPIMKSSNKFKTKKWFTPAIKTMHDQLCEMNSIRKRLNNPAYTERYMQFKLMYKNCIDQYKKQCNDQRLMNSNNIMRDTWKIINESKSINKKQSSIDICDSQGIPISTAMEKSNFINDYFINVISNQPKPNYNINIDKAHTSFFLTPTTPQEISEIIGKTTLKPAAGIDDISGKVIKSVKDIIDEPLAYLVNESFSAGVFPNLKESKCIPVYKNKGLKTDITNYRAICMPSQIAKIFEASYSIRLTNYLENFNLISNVQNGFRKSKSTNTAILDCIDFIYNALNNKSHVLGLFYDLSRAFDTIDHNLLLMKLEGIGVRGAPYSWAASYLQNRTQTTVVNGAKSETKNVKLGVPQGSILGPLFFIIFINDIPNTCITSNQLLLYADDTNMLMCHNCIEQIVINSNNASQEMSRYCNENGLNLNINKTCYMRFLPKNVVTNYDLYLKISNKSIQSTTATKFLGVTLDQKLTWKMHINTVCSKLSTICYIIRNLRDTVGINTLKTLYYGLVQSHLQYGLIFWGNSPYFNRAFQHQKKVIRAMCKTHPLASCKPLFKELQILTLPSLYIYQIIMLIKENESQFPRNSDIHTHHTRNRDNLYQPYSRLALGENSPRHIGIKCFNKINQCIDTGSNMSFKNKILKFLCDKAYYDVDEFLNY